MKRITKFFVASLSIFVSSRILANPVTVTVDGTSYDLTTTNITDHANLTEQETLDLFSSQPWFGDQALAEALADALRWQLGTMGGITTFTGCDENDDMCMEDGPIFSTSEDGTNRPYYYLGVTYHEENDFGMSSSGTMSWTNVADEYINNYGYVYALLAAQSQTSINTSWIQPYAAMQNVGLASIKNNRDLLLAKAGNCSNYGWVIENSNFCLYTNAKNMVSDVNANSTLGGYGFANFNTSVNVEKTFNEKWKAGIAYGFGSSNLNDFNTSNTTASLSSSNKHYSFYGVKKVNDKLTLKGMISGSDFIYKGKRNYLTTSATSEYNSDGYTSEIGLTWDLKSDIKNPISVKPSLGLAYAVHNQDRFNESGNGDLITLEANQAKSLLLKTGIKVDKQISMGGGKWLFVPSIALNYEFDTLSDQDHRGIKAIELGSSDEATLAYAKTFGEQTGSVNIGTDFVLKKNLMLNLNAEYGLAEGGDKHSYGGGFSWVF